MTNKYLDMDIEAIKKHWYDFSNVVHLAGKEKWPSISVLPEEAWALTVCVSQYFQMYKFGVQFEVFPLRPELVDGSVFHGIALELKAAYEQDKTIELDRESYIEFVNCANTLRKYSDIALKIAGIDVQENGVQ